jgi:2'-5' RNA ligase
LFNQQTGKAVFEEKFIQSPEEWVEHITVSREPTRSEAQNRPNGFRSVSGGQEPMRRLSKMAGLASAPSEIV